MADIFISYSRKDKSKADQLSELLASAGLSVWIDRQGIVGAEKWATEIVEGIRACTTFIILLSRNSIESENVLRELSLASEKRKRVLPITIEPTVLPSSFEYPLAGLQRLDISDFNAILRAHTHGVTHISVKDHRTSLIVLPFEDLSPPGEDNAWFADGLAGELIDAFGHIKSLRILDRKTSLELRGTKLRTVDIGKEFNTRYFIEGSVRKFGEQIKISTSLLDLDTGEYLWQESHRGVFKDIFDIQESVTQKVVAGLKLHLTKDEKILILERGTENTDAYELYIKSKDYFDRRTKAGFLLAIQLASEAIRLDPGYANAYQFKAYALLNLYRGYDRDPKLLDEGMVLVREALRLKPDLWRSYRALSFLLQLQGKIEEAESAAKEFVRHEPENDNSHFTLGFFYISIGESAKAITPFERAVELNPNDRLNLFSLVICCNGLNELEKQRYWAGVAIPLYERHLKLFPDDENARVDHALMLHCAGRNDEAREEARNLEHLKDANSLYNAACLQCMLGEHKAALWTCSKAIDAGFKNVQLLSVFLNTDEGALILKGTPEWDALQDLVENIKTQTNPNG